MAPLTTPTITIRPAYGDDGSALRALAALDSASGVPEGALLLAEVDGELRAALSVRSRTVIADPFFPTLELVALLRHHADAVGSPTHRRWRGLGRRRVRPRALSAA
ncbi:MAG: hypothetical protein QOD66_104 [Solirubrobacteraceae bacterium]|jgi:hypothetical protein|nr:hypothetical protein [Solirubrobacteraceae bacterium]